MMKSVVLAVAVVLAASAPAAAHQNSKHVHYIGIHPIEDSEEADFCYIEGPHVHIYGADKVRYRDHDGHKYFVGDPVAYGYDGPKYTYKGHHPIHVHVIVGSPKPDIEYCYLDGPHYHPFAPPEGPDFKLTGGAYFYVGAPSKPYLEARPVLIQINAIYRPLVYARPVVVVAAPVGWIGARVDIGGPVIAAPRAAAGISIDARVILPSVRVDIVPGVIVHDHHPHHRRHYKHKKYKHKKHKKYRRY